MDADQNNFRTFLIQKFDTIKLVSVEIILGKYSVSFVSIETV